MTLRYFEIFVAVCDTMNMTAAADRLFMSQSAVSQAVTELEKYYNVRLFERLSKKLFITEAGSRLLGYARHIISMNTDIESQMKSLGDCGSIRIGASVTVGAYVLPSLVSEYARTNKESRVTVVEDNTKNIEKMITTDSIDIAVVEGDITSPELIERVLTQDELVVICGRTHPFFGCPQVAPESLQDKSFIVREVGSGTRKTFEDVMDYNGLRWNAAWTCNNTETIKMAVAEGFGISVISKRAVKKEAAEGLLYIVPTEGLSFKRTFKIIYHKNKYLTNAMQSFIRQCLEMSY